VNKLTDIKTGYQPITYAERSEFYEIEHATDMDAGFLTSFLMDETKSVLEVPCGVGRNVFLFAEHGIEAVGIDLEHQMIAQAKQRLSDPLFARFGHNASFHQGDMRQLSLGRAFDLVVTPIDAFQLLLNDDDAVSALESLGNCVASEGSLIIDLARFGDTSIDLHSRPVFYDPKQPDGIIIKEWTRTLNTGATLTRSRRQTHDGRLMKFRFFYEVSGRIDERKLYTDLTLRKYNRSQIEKLIRQAGLTIVNSFGNHNRDELTDRSARLIYELQPNK